MKNTEIKNLGLIDYDVAMQLMSDLQQKRIQDKIPDTLLLLEHPPVITRGRRLHETPPLLSAEIQKKGIIVRNADRGGLLTYHGPGQIVVYFIIKITQLFMGIADTIRAIEERIQKFLTELGVSSKIIPEYPGIWVGKKKIASIGLRVLQGVTSHGISLNICNDLTIYQLFDPCGLSGNSMTNLESVLDKKLNQEDQQRFGMRLCELFAEMLTQK